MLAENTRLVNHRKRCNVCEDAVRLIADLQNGFMLLMFWEIFELDDIIY